MLLFTSLRDGFQPQVFVVHVGGSFKRDVSGFLRDEAGRQRMDANDVTLLLLNTSSSFPGVLRRPEKVKSMVWKEMALHGREWHGKDE